MKKNYNIGFEELSKYDKLIKHYINQTVNQKIEQVINKTIVQIPNIYGELEYDASTQNIPIENFNSTYCDIIGDTSAVQAGTYTVVVSLKDNTTTVWEDLTATDKTFTWKINKKILSVPAVTLEDNEYNSSAKTVNIETYNHLLISQSGDTTATNAGTYSLTFSLTQPANTEWDDQTITDKIVTWTINKKDQQRLINMIYEDSGIDKIVLDGNKTTTSLAWASATTPTATLSNNSVVTVTSNLTGTGPDNGEAINIYQFTITSINNNSGAATITISCPEDANHLGASMQMKILCFIPSWSTGTDAQIASILEAHYNNDLDLTDIWEVGQERQVTLSSITSANNLEAQPEQTITLVLMNKHGKTLTTPVNGNTECAFIVGQKTILSTQGKINTTNTGSISWKDTERRAWLNDSYKNALPSTIRGIFKQHKNATYDKANSTVINIDDYFSLPSIREIWGDSNYSATSRANPAESSPTYNQFEYYTDSSKTSPISNAVWTRTSYSNSGSWNWITTNDYWRMSDTYGILPFGVI